MKPMRYIRVAWEHDDQDEPIILYSELDDESWEVRKVEIFRDGRMDFADASRATGSTGLGLEPVPPLVEVATDPQFDPIEITRDEFERAWETARLVIRTR